MIGSWGSAITFTVSHERVLTPDGVSVSGAARLATHEIAGRYPVTEFIGPGLRICAMNIRLASAQGVTPRQQVETLRAAQDRGEANALILGGRPVFPAGHLAVIEQLDEQHTATDAQGRPTVIGLNVTFKQVAPRATATTATSSGTVTKKNVTKG